MTRYACKRKYETVSIYVLYFDDLYAYVGSSVSPEHRIARHIYDITNSRKTVVAITAKKHRFLNAVIIATYPIEERNIWEEFWLNRIGSCYKMINLAPIEPHAIDSMLSYSKYSQILSKAQLRRFQNPEAKSRLKAALNKPETKKRMQIAAKKRLESKEQRAKLDESISNSYKNKDDNYKQCYRNKQQETHSTDEFKQKHSQSQKLRFQRQNQIQRLINVNRFTKLYRKLGSVIRFTEPTELLDGFATQTYHHCIKRTNGQAWIYDCKTRNIVHVCKNQDIPKGYVNCSKSDSFELLKLNDKILDKFNNKLFIDNV